MNRQYSGLNKGITYTWNKPLFPRYHDPLAQQQQQQPKKHNGNKHKNRGFSSLWVLREESVKRQAKLEKDNVLSHRSKYICQ